MTADGALPESQSSLHNDFRAAVGGGWEAVNPAVRARMDRLLSSPEPTIFEGVGVVRRSRIGWAYAHLCRLVGGPLVWKSGDRVKTTVSVTPTANGLRCWHRTFVFEDGSSQLVQTTKVVDPKRGLLDAVGPQGERRLAMRMTVWTERNSLHFTSMGYILRFAGFAVPVPVWLTPGQLYAEHRNLGDGTFLYILKFTHPLWGETFYQEGRFREL
jgi:hypothetical protein